MGREATTRLTYGGETAEGRVLLESDELILRGELRARLPRAGLSNARIEDDGLVIDTPGGPLRLGLDPTEAGRWLAALAKPAPTLAEKLGIKAGAPVWAWGVEAEAALETALAGTASTAPAEATLGVAVVEAESDLDDVLAERGVGDAPLWLIYRKGGRGFGDAAIRERMRGLGFVDTKSCAVSAAFTATRYGPRKV